MAPYEILASAENNAYMQWQAMLFHYSCVTYHGQVPIIVVHQGDEPLLPGFELIRSRGGNVQVAANARQLNDVCYPPRNTAVALQSAKSDADYLVLCDCDMVFFRPMRVADLEISDDTITFDRVYYLFPDWPQYQPDIDDVFRAAGIDPARLRDPVIDGGVPHVIPTALQVRLATEWLHCIELFPLRFEEGPRPDSSDPRYANWPYRCYLASMWALVMAKHRLGLDFLQTKFSYSNYEDERKPPREGQYCLLHYAYGSPRFDKRKVGMDTCIQEPGFWKLPDPDGTIAGEIRRQFGEAGRYYGLA